MSEKDQQTIFQILSEIKAETTKGNGVIKQPEMKFSKWDKDFQEWDKRFTKRMKAFDTMINKQMVKIERFFE